MKTTWSTPQSRDGQSGGGAERFLNPERSRNLNDQMSMEMEVRNAKLNPRWVETLMGVPIGWTSPFPVTDTEVTNRTDELRLLGNGVVPATASLALRTLTNK